MLKWFPAIIRAFPVTRVAAIFVAVVCFSILALDGWLTWSARQAQLDEAGVAVNNLTLSIARHAEDTINEVDIALLGLVDVLEVDGSGADRMPRVDRLLDRYIAELPQLQSLLVLDSRADWIASTSDLPDGVNSADREYFRWHQDHSDTASRVGLPIRSRGSGDWILPVTKRYNYRDGSFAGVVRAGLSLRYFSDYYQGFDIGVDGTILLAFADGHVVLRRPFGDVGVGSDISRGDVFRRYLPHAPTGVAMTASVIDGVKRMVGYRRLQGRPLVAIAALSEKEILAGWGAKTWLRSVTVICLVAVLALIGGVLIAQIRRRSRTEKTLRRTRDDLQKVNEALEKLAMQDGLTGLANRRRLDTVMHQEFQRARRNGAPLALVMIDVDYFKQYNDHYGHGAGDECLKAISLAVGHVANRAGDLTARYGGEEIAVLLPGTDSEGAIAVAERIRVAVRALAIAHAGSRFDIVTVSAGVHATRPSVDAMSVTCLLQAADRALYAAKGAGRDRVMTEQQQVEAD